MIALKYFDSKQGSTAIDNRLSGLPVKSQRFRERLILEIKIVWFYRQRQAVFSLSLVWV